MDKNSLVEVLKEHTKIYEYNSNKWNVIITEYGGRIIGIFPRNQYNLLWVNPDLRKTLAEENWNLGGARIWISPEKNFYYKKPTFFEEWVCQRDLDPGNYTIKEKDTNYVKLENRFSIYDFLNNTTLNGNILREIFFEKADDILEIHIYENLITENFSGSLIDLWALVQVNPGINGVGTVVIPTKKDTKPIPYFGDIPSSYLKVDKDAVFFRIDCLKVLKLGIRPEDLPIEGIGKIGYITRASDKEYIFLMLYSRCCPRKQGECLDVPKNPETQLKGCIQSYNSGPEGDFQGFGEIEMHFMPSEKIGNRLVSRIDYDLIAYTGDKREVLEKAMELLDIEYIRLF